MKSEPELKSNAGVIRCPCLLLPATIKHDPLRYKELPPVICTGAHQDCAKANYGIGCYHRLPHDHSNNCEFCKAADTGLHFCSFRNIDCKCSERW